MQDVMNWCVRQFAIFTKAIMKPKKEKERCDCMSRILCPECGTKISCKAIKCPNCGFQSADDTWPISEQDKYETVPIFEYDIEEWKPNRDDLSIISYEDNRSLIEYFGNWETIQIKLPAIAEVIGAMAGKRNTWWGGNFWKLYFVHCDKGQARRR